MKFIFRVKPKKATLCIFFPSRIMRSRFSWVFCIYMRKNYYFDNKCTRWVGLTFFEKLLLYRTITSNVNEVGKEKKFTVVLTFFLCVFFGRFTGQHGKGGGNIYSPLPFPPTHKHSDIYL